MTEQTAYSSFSKWKSQCLPNNILDYLSQALCLKLYPKQEIPYLLSKEINPKLGYIEIPKIKKGAFERKKIEDMIRSFYLESGYNVNPKENERLISVKDNEQSSKEDYWIYVHEKTDAYSIFITQDPFSYLGKVKK
jgi:hypothetical protein